MPGLLAAFSKQLALEADNRNAWNLLAYACQSGDLPAAVEALRPITECPAAAPEDPNPIDSLGDVHLITALCAVGHNSLYPGLT